MSNFGPKWLSKHILSILSLVFLDSNCVCATEKGKHTTLEKTAKTITRTWSLPIMFNIPSLSEPESQLKNVDSQSIELNMLLKMQKLNGDVPINKDEFFKIYTVGAKQKRELELSEEAFKASIVALKNPKLTALIDPKNMIESLRISDHYFDSLCIDNLLFHIPEESKRLEVSAYKNEYTDTVERKLRRFFAPLDAIVKEDARWEYWKKCLCTRPMSLSDRVKVVSKNKVEGSISTRTTESISWKKFMEEHSELEKAFNEDSFYKMIAEIRLITIITLINLDSCFDDNDESWTLFKWGCLAGDICVVPWRHIIGDVVGNCVSDIGEFRGVLADRGGFELTAMFDRICDCRTKLALTDYKLEAIARVLWGRDWVKEGQETIKFFKNKKE